MESVIETAPCSGKKRKRGDICSMKYCSKCAKDGVSLHKVPKGGERRKAWLDFAKTTRRDVDKLKTVFLCSDHFIASDYRNHLASSEQFGINFKRYLKESAIPSIFPVPTEQQVEEDRRRYEVAKARGSPLPATACPSASLHKRAAAAAKRSGEMMIKRQKVVNKLTANRAIQEYSLINDQSATQMCEDSAAYEYEGSSISSEGEPGLTESLIDEVTDMANSETQTTISWFNRAHAKVGTGKKRLNCKDQEMQSEEPISKHTVDAEVTCDLVPLPPLMIWDPESDLDRAVDDTIDDPDWEQDSNCSSELVSPDGTPVKSAPIQENSRCEKKYLVTESALLQLFRICSECTGESSADVRNNIGTLVEVSQKCKVCGAVRTWRNQSMTGKMPSLNLLLSAAIAVSGATTSKVMRIFDFMGIVVVKTATYYRHVDLYIQPTIMIFWEDHQKALFKMLDQVHKKNVVLAGDGRCDSPGHCAKYGSYTFMEQQTNRVLHTELIQSNEVKSSYHLEHEGLVRGVMRLKEEGLSINQFISDRHVQNRKWIRENMQESQHYFDIWHVAKGLAKKLEATSKRAACRNIGPWIKCIVNHMYYVASSTPDGNADTMEEKWRMLPLHIQNIHTQCPHGRLSGDARNRLWLAKESEEAVTLENMLLNKRLIGDIRQLSPVYQTSTLEAKHSLDIRFVPKNTSYSYNGMKTKLCLSALHYNENADRLQKVTKEGKPKFALRFPKAKKGGYSINPVKTAATYNYATEIMDQVITGYKANSAGLQAKRTQLKAKVPPTLSAAYEKPDISEAVHGYKSRFAKNTLIG